MQNAGNDYEIIVFVNLIDDPVVPDPDTLVVLTSLELFQSLWAGHFLHEGSLRVLIIKRTSDDLVFILRCMKGIRPVYHPLPACNDLRPAPELGSSPWNKKRSTVFPGFETNR
jgi:hypothetical protein